MKISASGAPAPSVEVRREPGSAVRVAFPELKEAKAQSTVSIDDISLYERDEPYNPPPVSLSRAPVQRSFFSAACQWLLKPLALSLPLISGYLAVTNIKAAVEKEQPTETEIQNCILLSLSLGASLQNTLYVFPSRVAAWLRFYQYRLLGFELFSIDSLFILLGKKYGLFFAWTGFRYGAVLIDMLYSVKNKIMNSNTATGGDTLRVSAAPIGLVISLKKYASLPWKLLFSVSVVGITSAHILSNYRNHLGDSISQELIISYASGIGYASLGFCLGDWIERLTAHRNSSASSMQNGIYYVYGVFLTPGDTPYHFALLSLGGMMLGWNNAYSKRKLQLEQQLIVEQIAAIKQLANDSNSTFFSQLDPYSTAHIGYLAKKRALLGHIKYGFFAVCALQISVSWLWSPWYVYSIFTMPGIAFFLGTYFHARKKLIQDIDHLHSDSYYNLLMHNNPLLFSGIFTMLSKLSFRVMIRLNQNPNQIDHPIFLANIAMSAVLSGIYAAPNYMRWWEQLESDRPVDKERFTKLERGLSQSLSLSADDEKPIIELTPREITFVSKAARQVGFFAQNRQVSNNQSDKSLKVDVMPPPPSLLFAPRTTTPSLLLRREKEDDNSSNKKFEKTMQAFALLHTTTLLSIRSGSQIFNL